MGAMFKSPQTPTVTPVAAPPPSEAVAEEEAKKERERLRGKATRTRTILTGPQGLTTPATTELKTLLS
jgi:hypothetical protein